MAITLHWVMALGILALAALGLVMVHGHLALGRRFALYQLHKSIGVTILIAALLRLGWRLAHRPPALPTHMPQRERVAAHAGHGLLYFFLIALPLTGWALVSASKLSIPTHLYGLIPWPHLPILPSLHHKAPVEALLKAIHRYGAWSLLLLVAGHAGAALRHHFVHKDDVLLRMLPRLRGNRPTSRVLGPEKRTPTNRSELERIASTYPLRFDRKQPFKQASGSGQFSDGMDAKSPTVFTATPRRAL